MPIMDTKVAVLCTKRGGTATDIAQYFSQHGAEIDLFVIETAQRRRLTATERQFQQTHQAFDRWLGPAESMGALARGIRNVWHRLPAPIQRWLFPLLALVGPHSVARSAKRLGIPVVKVRRHSTIETRQILESHGISIALLASSQWLIKEPLLSMADMRIINAHCGKLPQHRSLDSLPWSVLQNDETGLTAHLIDEGVDTGPILFFQPIPANNDDNLRTLRTRINNRKPEVFFKAVEGLSAGTIVPAPQKEADGTHHRPMTLDELIEAQHVLEKGSELFSTGE